MDIKSQVIMYIDLIQIIIIINIFNISKNRINMVLYYLIL